MADLLKGENSGVVVDVRETDYKAGANSPLVYEVVNVLGDWEQYKPTDEWQRRYQNGALGYDTNSCTNFSCLNSIEAQIEHMLGEGLIPMATVQKMHDLGWFDNQGNVNFNDWYNAVTSGTTDAQGNTLYGPWDAVRKVGLIGQSKGYKVNDFTSASGWFNSKPTPAQLELGSEFLNIFDVAYEWVSLGQLNQWDLFNTHLKQAPLHVLVPTRDNWNSTKLITNIGPYTGVNHAIDVIGQKANTSHKALDHYTPFVKQLAWDYYIPYALKGVITLKSNKSFVFTKDLQLDMTDPDVLQLQRYLNSHGFPVATPGQPGSPGNETKYFGTLTQKAVAKFQTVNHITPNAGYFGPKTRAIINKS